VVLVNWIRSKVSKPAERAGKSCILCLEHLPGTTDEELFFNGGVILEGAGWFCGPRCQNQYRLRFRIQATRTTSGETARAAPASSRPSGPFPVPETKSPTEPRKAELTPAAEALADALRTKRRQSSGG